MIGVFDSGLGGLTAIRSLEELLPNEKIIYFNIIIFIRYIFPYYFSFWNKLCC